MSVGPPPRLNGRGFVQSTRGVYFTSIVKPQSAALPKAFHV
jgi:hypothetical protein